MDGGGVKRHVERERARSWWAFLECEGARWGIAGVSPLEALPLDDRVADTVADRFGEEAVSKNPLR